jgi:hypothetical protein
MEVKGVSGLKACLDRSYRYARSLQRFEFSRPFVLNDILLRKMKQHLTSFSIRDAFDKFSICEMKKIASCGMF